MAWIYLAVSEDSPSPSAILSNQLPIAKSTHTVRECSSQECMTNICRWPRSGMTSGSWEWECYQAASRCYMVVFPVRTSALQEMEQAWKESEADCFSRSLDCVARLSRDSSFWRTYLPLLQGVEQKWSERLPKWGMTYDGALYPLHPLEHYTVARDGSYWLTPSTMDHLPVREGEALERCLHRGTSTSRRKVSGRLNEQIAYPRMWPTPMSRDWKGKTNSNRNSQSLPDCILDPEAIGKKLCPRWVSVLMGYRTTHTDLDPLVMPWFLSKQKKRSKSS